jgi:hypothetical protein
MPALSAPRAALHLLAYKSYIRERVQTMNFLAVTFLAVFQLAPIQGSKMPRDNILGVRFDMLKREAHLVLGRRQSLLEVDAHGWVTNNGTPPGSTGASPGSRSNQGIWKLQDGHLSELDRPPLSSAWPLYLRFPGEGRPVPYMIGKLRFPTVPKPLVLPQPRTPADSPRNAR